MHTGHVVEVTFQSHYKAHDLLSNTTQLSSSIFNSGRIMLHSNGKYECILDENVNVKSKITVKIYLLELFIYSSSPMEHWMER